MHHLILRILFLTAALIAENAHFTRAEAAGPLSHIYYANYWLKAQNIKLSDTDKSLFFKGTLFPDIRYLHVIRRADTHKKHVNLVTLKKCA